MRSILLIRLSAIGDVVMASPLPEVFKRAWPEVRVTWVVEPQAATLVQGHPGVDRVVVWPKAEWKRLFRSLRWVRLLREGRAFLRELRADRYDLAVDLQGLLKSGLLARVSGARERVGLGSREGSGWLMTRVVSRGGDPRRIGSEYRHLAQVLGLDPGAFYMRVGVPEQDGAVAEALQRRHADGYAVGCPFTTRPQKHWVEQAWVDLARELHARHGLPLVLLGGAGDRTAAQRIAARAGEVVEDLVGRTSLTQAAAVIRGARLLVGVDTGLTHMGPAFDVPTVALFGSTCPYLETGRDNTVVIYHDLPCAPCRRNPVCDGRFDCMTGITPEEVLQRVAQVMPHGEERT
ncbi:MAG: glycosyltransferase family 9 protein [Ectothiorhodospira sp.]